MTKLGLATSEKEVRRIIDVWDDNKCVRFALDMELPWLTSIPADKHL